MLWMFELYIFNFYFLLFLFKKVEETVTAIINTFIPDLKLK